MARPSLPVTCCGAIRAHFPTSRSHLMFNLMYFIITTMAILITNTYILLGRMQSTLIPCIHAAWYKVFTLLSAVIASATVILVRLERPGKFSCYKTGMLWGQRKFLILTIEYAVVIEDDPADGRPEAGVATVSAMLIIQGYNKCKKSYDRLRFFTASHMYRNPALSSSPPCPSTIS